jgi:acetolactate synthase I/II/III large subunit
MKNSDVIAKFLKDQNVQIAFGIIGSGNAHLFDSIASLGYTEIICVHHEQAAVMAAMGYYRTCGKVAVVLPTTGAGSTNAVTGVVSAWMDSIPVWIISGNENSKFTSLDNPLRIWGIQGYASAEMVKNVTKFSGRMDQNNVAEILWESWESLQLGRPGPVWLDVPMNIQSAPATDLEKINPQFRMDAQKKKQSEFATRQSTKAMELDLITDAKTAAEKIHQALSQAQRPLLWLGHGLRLSGAQDLVPAFVEQLGIPTLVSWAGLDLLPSDHPLCFGRAGVYGQRASNLILQNSDFIIGLGTRFAMPQVGYEIQEFAREAKIAAVDIDPAELGKYRSRFNIPVLSDAKLVLQEISKLLPSQSLTDGSTSLSNEGSISIKDNSGNKIRWSQWIKTCQLYREKFPTIGPEHKDAGGFINSYRFMDKLSDHMTHDQIIVTDMGTALLSGHQALRLKSGQRMMTSTGLGEMGFGLPAAIGASFANNRGPVLCLNCDGGMMMNLQELQTMVHHQLPIKIIVFNNDGYLMIKHTQKALFKGRYTSTNKQSGVSCPDYSKISYAFGIPSCQVRSWDDFDNIIPNFLNSPGPALCEVYMDPEQLFVPKLSLAVQPDGSIVSPPLEDLTPLIPRETLAQMMIVGLHPKSKNLMTEKK